MTAAVDANTALQVVNIALIVWMGKRQVFRLDMLETWLNKLRERVAALEAKQGR